MQTPVIPTVADSYMFQHYHHRQGAYTNILLKHTAINSLQKTCICFDVSSASFGLKFYIYIYIYIKYKTELLIE